MKRYDDFDLNEFNTLDDDPFSHALSEDLPYKREKSPENVPIVTIFGAGVSGLSAAHELVQRGFLVQVVEKAQDHDDEYRADIGGLAKSQPARLKRTRRLHWNLYSTTEQNAYLKASPILEEIDVEDDEYVYPEYTSPTREKEDEEQEDEEQEKPHKEKIRDALHQLPDFSTWPAEFQMRVEAETLLTLRLKIAKAIRERKTGADLENVLKTAFAKISIPDLKIKIEEKQGEVTTFEQPNEEELSEILQPVRDLAFQLCSDPVGKAIKENESDLEVLRALREQPFQKAQTRFPISQRLSLPIGRIEKKRTTYLWTGDQRREVLRSSDRENSQIKFLNTLYDSFTLEGKEESQDMFHTEADAYCALIGLIDSIPDIQGEIQAQLGYFDKLHLNNQKIEQVAAQICRAVVEYSNDLEREYSAVQRNLGETKSIKNRRTRARELYMLEIRSYCNLVSKSIRRNKRIAKLWSQVVKFWIIRTIKDQSGVPGSAIKKILDNYEGGSTQDLIDDLQFQLKAIGLVSDRNDDSTQSKIRTNYTDFRVIEHVVLGEHGFRFFPGFYRHVFNTMQRTPILDGELRETGRTVYDQLVAPPPVRIGIAGDSQFYKLDRDSQSPEEIGKRLQWMARTLGFKMRDFLRFQTQLVKFATSSPERRRLYEDFSWLEFVDAKSEYSKPNPEEMLKKGSTKYSQSGEQLLRELPQLLVAMSAEETDALTEAQTTLQLMLDDTQTTEGDRDKMLNGPTSTSWLQHWRRYLTRQGVRFFVGELCHVRFVRDELIPVVKGAGPGGLPVPENPFDVFIERKHLEKSEPSPDFYILATPYQKATDQLWNVNDIESNSDGDQTAERVWGNLVEVICNSEPDITWQVDQSFDRAIQGTFELEEPHHRDKLPTIEQLEQLRNDVMPTTATWHCNLVDRLFDKLGFLLNTKVDKQALTPREKVELHQTDLGRLNGDLQRMLEFDIAAGRRDSEGNRRTGFDSTFKVPRNQMGLPQPQFQFPLRDLTGVQYYFRELVRIGHGHFLLPKSPWGVSGIGQMYIWRRRPSRTHGFIGQLSVDIGDFYETYKGPDKFVPKTAWNSTAYELAEDSWSQITDAAGVKYRTNVSKPRYFQIDNGLNFYQNEKNENGEPLRDTPRTNYNMLMINLPGQWKYRPGLRDLDDGERCIEYEVSNKRWVMAGNFMASHTRLATMESANESGRLAANAIMKHLWETQTPNDYNGGGTFVGDYAQIWDPERHEPTILEIFKNLDRELYHRRVPHFLDILDIPRAIERIPDREEPNDPNSTRLYNLSTLIEQAIVSPNKEFGVLNDFAKQAGLGNADNLLAKVRQASDFSNKMLEMMIEIFESGKTR